MNLYLRYLLPDEKIWKNSSKGTLFEQRAAYRFNRENRKWLLVFSLRWFVLGVLFNIAASTSILVLDLPVLGYPFDILSAIAFAMCIIFIVLRLLFEWEEE